jgi:lipopolysaccharide export system permease protein
MFRTIDRYLLRQFLQIFVICFISLYGLYVVIDAFAHLDHFIDHASEEEGLLSVIGKYYSYRSLAFFDRTSGILALIAAMFTVTWIQRHNELTALLAAGIPRLRVLRPVIVAALSIGVFAAICRELVVPQVRDELARNYKNLDGQNGTEIQSHWDTQTDIFLSGESVVIEGKRIIRPNFSLPRVLATYGKQLAAEEAIYMDVEGERPAGFLLRGVISPAMLPQRESLRLGGVPVVVTPRDVKWLGDNEVFVASGVSFDLLAGGSTWRNFASTHELVRELRSPSNDLGNDVRVALHTRLLQPFFDATLLFLGLPLVVNRTNRNPFIAIGLAILVVASFFVIVLACQSLGSTGWMRPVFASWLPLMLFAPIAAASSETLRR